MNNFSRSIPQTVTAQVHHDAKVAIGGRFWLLAAAALCLLAGHKRSFERSKPHRGHNLAVTGTTYLATPTGSLMV